MKLILCLTLIWMLSSTAEALWCMYDRGNGGLTSEECTSPDEVCATVAIQDFRENQQLYTVKAKFCRQSILCPKHGQTFSFSNATWKMAHSIQCCNTDNCNNQTLPYPDLVTKNGLRCSTCAHDPSLHCNQTIECVGVQDRCITGHVTSRDKTHPVHGCASANVCEPLSDPRVLTAFIGHSSISSQVTCNPAGTVSLSAAALLLGLTALIVC